MQSAALSLGTGVRNDSHFKTDMTACHNNIVAL
jgi:hypothetical protein